MDENNNSLTHEIADNYISDNLEEVLDKDADTSNEKITPELINTINGVNYCFDTFGISPEQTITALKKFDDRIVLITGSDDNVNCDLLGKVLINKVKHLILIGQTAGSIELSLMKEFSGKNSGIDIRITRCFTLKQAVDCACLSSKPNDVVLLSPAGKKFSNYKSFDEIKTSFDKYVNS